MKNKHISDFFSLSIDMLCIANFDGYFIELNPAWEKTLGWSVEELCAEPFINFVHPEDREKTIVERQKLAAGEITVQFENRYRHKNGEYRWILWSASVDLESRIICAVARDNTEQKMAAAQLAIAKRNLEENEKFLNVALGALPVLVCYLDSNFRYRYINPTYEKWFDVTWEKSIGRSIAEVLGRSSFEAVQPFLELALKGETQEFECEVPRGASGNKVLHGKYIPDRDTKGNICGIIAVVQDITKLKVIQADIATKTELLDTIVENIPHAVFLKDVKDNFKVKLWNKSAEKIFQVSRDAIIGKSAHDLWPKDQADLYLKVDTEVVEKKVVVDIEEEPSHTKDRGTIYLKTRKLPLFIGSEGSPNFLLVICEDITDRREKSRTLDTLYSIIQESEDAFAYADENGELIFINEMLRNELGWRTEGNNIFDYLISSLQGQLKSEIIPFVVDEGRQWEGETLLRNIRTGDENPFLIRVFGLKDQSGNLKHYAMTARDLRQRKKWEIAMQNAAKMSSLGEMAGGIAHEINNPLAIIHAQARQLKRRVGEGSIDLVKLKEDLQKIEATADRIAKIVNGLLSFSRNSERDPMEFVNISQIINDTLELCRERFRNHAIDLRVKDYDDISLEARASQISQVIMNLLGNAHDAVEHLSERWVEVDIKPTGDFMEIGIKDSGPGIPEPIAQKLMQPFFTTKEVGKGTGLGLSLSKGITEDHHGYLRYDSSSKNTRFVLTLPIRQPQRKSGATGPEIQNAAVAKADELYLEKGYSSATVLNAPS